MVITTPTRQPLAGITTTKVVTAGAIVCCLTPFGTAAELTILPALSTGLVTQEVKQISSDKASLDTINIDPSLTVDYRSRTFEGRFTGSHQHLIRDIDGETTKDDFNTYDYDATYEIVENLLNIQASGGLNLLNLSPGEYLISDRFSNPDSLSKTRTNRVSFDLDADKLDWVTVNSTLLYSSVESEQQSFGSDNLEGNTYEWNAQFSEGENLESSFFTVFSSFSQTKSDGDLLNGSSRRSDQKSRELDAFFTNRIYGNFGIVFQGRNEAYQFDSVINSDSRRDFTSYGSGLAYIQSPNRYIALTYNRGERDDDDKDYFVGGNLQWAFSGRTNLRASYGKRYYGDAGNFQFSYNTKTIRASVNYSENVTNFSRLTGSAESIGVFICPSNDINITSCYQPNSLNAQLEPGEQFTEFTDFVVEVSDEPILIKRSNTLIGYSKTKFSTALEFRYSNPFYEDSGREQVTYTTSWSANYELGPKTDLRSQLVYVETNERRGEENIGQGFEDTIYRAIAAMSYKINDNLLADLEFRFVDRDSDVVQRDVSDRRVSITFKYSFD